MKVVVRDPDFITLRPNIALILDDGRNVADELGVESAFVSWDKDDADRCTVTIQLNIEAKNFHAADADYKFPGEE